MSHEPPDPFMDDLRAQLAAKDAEIADLRAEYRDRVTDAKNATTLLWEMKAERDAAMAKLAEAEQERDYLRGYEADFAAIRKVLDEHNAPHDSEDGASLDIVRVRLLAEQRDRLAADVNRLRDVMFRIVASGVLCAPGCCGDRCACDDARKAALSAAPKEEPLFNGYNYAPAPASSPGEKTTDAVAILHKRYGKPPPEAYVDPDPTARELLRKADLALSVLLGVLGSIGGLTRGRETAKELHDDIRRFLDGEVKP